VGDFLTEEEQSQTSPRTYGDIFDELCPHYLVMGMTAEQYWDGESELKKFYRKAYQIRLENERKAADRDNWYMGIYVRLALASVPLLVNGFVPHGAEVQDYPEQPFYIQEEERKKEENRKKYEENQMQLAMAMMQARMAEFNKHFLERQKAEAESGKE